MKSSVAFLPLATALWLSAMVTAQDPNCAPGGNFDLTRWNLQLPIGSSSNPNSPRIIPSSELAGCDGWSHSSYFFTSSSGSLITKVPGDPSSSGCVTTPNSNYCRTELRESSPSSWNPRDNVNRLKVTLRVKNPGNGVAIGQILHNLQPNKPVAELYYRSNGDIEIGVAQTTAGGNQILTDVGRVNVGTTFTFELRYEQNTLSISLNNGPRRTLSTYSLNAPPCYFKTGNYNQGSAATEIAFDSISVSH